MAVFVFTNAFLTVGGVDLSANVTKLTLKTGADAVDTTAMGATYKGRKGGLKDWSITVEFQQDFAAAKVDATIWPLLGTSAAVAMKAVNAATSATNPQYSGNVLVEDYSPIANGVGELATTSLTWSGDGVLTRAVV